MDIITGLFQKLRTDFFNKLIFCGMSIFKKLLKSTTKQVRKF